MTRAQLALENRLAQLQQEDRQTNTRAFHCDQELKRLQGEQARQDLLVSKFALVANRQVLEERLRFAGEQYARQTGAVRIQPAGRGVVYQIVHRPMLEERLHSLRRTQPKPSAKNCPSVPATSPACAAARPAQIPTPLTTCYSRPSARGALDARRGQGA